MKIDDLTIGQARELARMFGATNTTGGGTHSFIVGSAYAIRATYHHIGRIVAITDTDIVLEDGGWLADSGRFGNMLATGTLKEIECPPRGTRWIVNRGDIIDAWPWIHTMPTETR